MFEEYRDQVWACFQEKKASNGLSPNLNVPSRAALRRECLLVFSERFRETDLETLRIFFTTSSDKRACEKALDQSSAELFRTLNNYVRGETQQPENRIVELLAWLIDFTPRPYSHYRQLRNQGGSVVAEPTPGPETAPGPSGQEPVQPTGGPNPPTLFPVPVEQKDDKEDRPDIDPQEEEELQVFPEGAEHPKKNLRRMKFTGVSRMTYSSVGVLIIVAIYIIIHRPKCMTWKYDRYELVSCEEPPPGALVIPFDDKLFTSFRKITQPDTLTQYSDGKVFYLKYHNKVEFFTMNGFHPVYRDKALKQLTEFIRVKYAGNNRTPVKKVANDYRP